MIEKIITVSNRAGIHARPAAMLVQAVKDFKCTIHYEKGRDRINGKSIMGIITLGAAYETKLRIIADGEDEQEAVETIARIFAAKFEEE
ncbi:MAG: HPr family phosphocarrier protein [Treponema sp.]|jgi:phosphocarrier protein|nr:HPr family phosphocarrier protein [Treponema sp.]